MFTTPRLGRSINGTLEERAAKLRLSLKVEHGTIYTLTKEGRLLVLTIDPSTVSAYLSKLEIAKFKKGM